MLIRCPKCNVSYDIGTATIPTDGKKVRCSQCGEVWVCLPEELTEQPSSEPIASETKMSSVSESDTLSAEDNEVAVTPDSGENPTEEAPQQEETEPVVKSEMQEIFARLETQTESLFEYEKSLPPHLKVWYSIKSILGLQRRRNRQFFICASVVLFLLVLFYLRFDIVRAMPFMEKVYSVFFIDSVIPGEGLEFQNITRNEFEEDYINKMEIRGFIANITDETVDIPVMQIELLDKNVQALQVIYQEPPVPRIVGGGKVAFRIVITKPSSFSKYVYLTFTREHPKDTLKAVNVRPDEI